MTFAAIKMPDMKVWARQPCVNCAPKISFEHLDNDLENGSGKASGYTSVAGLHAVQLILLPTRSLKE
jgi:hypothetical protein